MHAAGTAMRRAVSSVGFGWRRLDPPHNVVGTGTFDAMMDTSGPSASDRVFGPNSAQVKRFLAQLATADDATWATIRADGAQRLVSRFVWSNVVYAGGEKSRSAGRFFTTSAAADDAAKNVIAEDARRRPESYPSRQPGSLGRLLGRKPLPNPEIEIRGLAAGFAAKAVAERDLTEPSSFAVEYLPFGRVIPLEKLDAPGESVRFGAHDRRATLFLDRINALSLDEWKSVAEVNARLSAERSTDILKAIIDHVMADGVESPMRRIADEVGLIVLQKVPKPETPGIRGAQGWFLVYLPPLAAGLLGDWCDTQAFFDVYQPFDHVLPLATLRKGDQA
jgi:hypothetical protein